MKASTRKKLGLATTLALSLTAVVSASVTTFAWFQSNASATVTAQSDSTTITVSKPDDYTFYGYNGNTNSSFTPNGTFSHDFTALTTASLVSEYTALDGMAPGNICVFAVGISGASSANLTLKKIISNNATKENILDTSSAIQERYVYGTASHKINVGYAIDIFVSSYTPVHDAAPTGYSYFVTSPEGKMSAGGAAGTDKFNFSVETANDREDLDTGTHANQEITLSGTNKGEIEFFNNASLSESNDLYIMWSVVFSDANSVHYKEVTNAGVAVDERPSTGPRYFQQNNAGTSNCYGGLSFALTEFALTIG